MKKLFLSFAFLLLILSCGNNSRQNSSILYDNDSTYDEVTDSINNVISIDSSSRSAFPIGYTKIIYNEYIPKNDIERRLLADLKQMTYATNKLDYKEVVRLYYPDYFKYLQKQFPNMTISEIKVKVEGYLREYLAERNREYKNVWPKTKGAGIVVTNIMNRVKEGNGLLYLYEYHTFLFSDTETLFKMDAEYSIAASLNNGEKWYSTANSIEENFEILGISFSRDAIDKVLTKK